LYLRFETNYRMKLDIKLSELLCKKVEVLSRTPLSGGDINDVFKIQTNLGNYCIKQNNREQFPEMLKQEADGLKELSKSLFRTPEIIVTFEDGNHQYLCLEFIESGNKSHDFWNIFGEKLAGLHQISSDQFGFIHDNYIGSLPQSNKQHSTWSDFYAQERILTQVQLAYDKNRLDFDSVKRAENLCLQLNDLFPNEPPALLHGDLWSGNYMVDVKGSPVLIDPAVYYGHREMDLGMMKLFGGFDEEVFKTYDERFPLEKGWQKRIPLTQLYPLLVHVNLFGGGYANSVENTLKAFT